MKAWPIQITLKRTENVLEIEFDDGNHFCYSAEFLRIESPSAENKGHGQSQKRIVSGKSNVAILSLEPIGNYAIRIIFDDHHETGIYSWAYLYELGKNYQNLWGKYLQAVQSLGLN